MSRRAPGLGADDQAADGRSGLQPGGRVDHVPDRERLSRIAPVHADDRLARVHRRTRPERKALRAQLRNRLEHPQARAHSSLRVVAVRHRSPEHGHHRVPDELLDNSAIGLDPLAGDRVVRAQGVSDVLGIRVVRRGGEPLEVDEQDRDELPLLARGGRVGERRAALWAEQGARRRPVTTARARDPIARRRRVHPEEYSDAGRRSPRGIRPACDDRLQGGVHR